MYLGIYKYIAVCMYVCDNSQCQKEARNSKESMDENMKGLGGREGKGEMIQLSFNLRK